MLKIQPSSRVVLSLFVFLTLLISGCATKKAAHKEVYGPAYEAPPTSAPQSPIPPTSSAEESPLPNLPAETKRIGERPRVGLVLGGNNVSSFAAVGLLKRFQEEGIRLDFIVATGWPATLALGYGFTRSVHDLEWLAMRMESSDFSTKGMFGAKKRGFSRTLENAFREHGIQDTRLPVILSIMEPDSENAEIRDRGDWQEALTLALASGEGKTNRPHLIDVEEGIRREAKTVVAVSFYGDSLDKAQKAEINKQLKQASVSAHIELPKNQNDFGSRRLAILTGYREGAKLAKKIRGLYGNRSTP